MSDFQEKEYFQYQQQRFEAALKFATWLPLSIKEAIERADELIAELEDSRTKK